MEACDEPRDLLRIVVFYIKQRRASLVVNHNVARGNTGAAQWGEKIVRRLVVKAVIASNDDVRLVLQFHFPESLDKQSDLLVDESQSRQRFGRPDAELVLGAVGPAHPIDDHLGVQRVAA